MLFRSLKVLGRPVEYVVHPGATHEITRSGDNRQRMDQLLRTFEFFERWTDKGKRTSHQLWLITIYPMMIKLHLA
jgi:dipeptidyl aminopeptidase/acylaminoacyl peptidase